MIESHIVIYFALFLKDKPMPVTVSAKRALRKDRKRNLVNNRIRTKLRLSIKQFKLDSSTIDLSQVYSVIDTAAKKNILHKNKAARLKSQLSQIQSSQKPLKSVTKSVENKKKLKSTKKTAKKAKTS